MKDNTNISVLHIDLDKKDFAKKSYPDLVKYVGGIGVSSKIILDNFDLDPVTFAIGPLNGYFPFASKTSAAFVDGGKFYDTYVGGRLHSRLRFTGLDALSFEKASANPIIVSIVDNEVSFLPADTDITTLGVFGKRSVVSHEKDGLTTDQHFVFGERNLSDMLLAKNVKGFVVSGTQSYKVDRTDKYSKQYEEILSKTSEMLVETGDFPSCSHCPMGCSKARVGESDGNFLVHCLVSCIYSEKIFGDLGVVFASLSSIGYDYRHEDLEALPSLVAENIKKIYEKISHSKLERK